MRESKTRGGWRRGVVTLAVTGALALSAVTAGLMPVSAYAADGTVTITQKANPGATYDAYRLFTADIDDQNAATRVEWDDAITLGLKQELVDWLKPKGYGTWLTENGLTDEDAETAQNALEFISAQIAGATDAGSHNPKWVDAGTFADDFAEWVTANLTLADTATEGQEFTGPEGYYLFVTTAGTLGGSDVATAPIWFPLGGSATTIDEKATPVTITKEVQEDSDSSWGEYADAELGQEVSYRITVTVPENYNAYDTFYAQVTDTLPTGMEVVADSVRVTVGGADVTALFAVVYPAADSKVLTVTCEDTKKVPQISAGSSIVVTYKAKLVSLEGVEPVYGGAGNENEATYTFSNNPDSTSTGTIDDTAKLFVYTASVDKFDKVTNQPLAGAEFVIKNQDGKFLAEDWTWTADGYADGAQKKAQVFTTNEDGAITGIKGLDEGVYTLIETKAPGGYTTPTGAAANITITITREFQDGKSVLTGTASGALYKNDSITADSTTGDVNVDVVNDKNISLAMTGAEGVGIGGAVVLAIGLGWYLVRTNRRKAE